MLLSPSWVASRLASACLNVLLKLTRARGIACRACGAIIYDPVEFVNSGCSTCGGKKLSFVH